MPFKSREKRNEYAKQLMRRRRLDPVLRQSELEWARTKRRNGGNRRVGACVVCGYSETVDLHHEGASRQEYILCPNCHALITRGLKTLDRLLHTPIVIPELDADGNIIPEMEG